MIARVFLILSIDAVYATTELGYILISQVKEKKNVFSKMLLQKREKTQQEIKKMD